MALRAHPGGTGMARARKLSDNKVTGVTTKDLKDYSSGVSNADNVREMLFVIYNAGAGTVEIAKSATTSTEGAEKIGAGGTGRLQVHYPMEPNDYVLKVPASTEAYVSVYEVLP